MKLLIISIVLFSLSEICLSLQLYANENIDVTTDDIKRLRRQLFITQAYDKFARPIPKNDSYKVSVDYNLIHITNFDLRAQTLTTEGWLFMQWHDEGLVWQGQQEFKKIHNIRVPADQLYTPDMMAYNSIEFNKQKMTFTNAIVYNNGMVIWVPPITLKALCNVNIKYWPYDEHNCFLKFGSWTFDGHVMDVTPMNKTNPGLLKDIWKNTEFHITYINVTRDVKYYDCCREPYPSVTFFFKLQRRPTLYHYIISMPAIVAIISSLATFWLPIRSNNRFILNSVSLIILSLLLIFLGIQFGMSSFGVPIAVRFISLTTLFVGLLQVWITIAFNTSQLKGQIPVWAMKFTKPLIQLYRNTEHESIQLTQSEQTADVTNKKSVAKHPNAEDLTFIVDKLLFIVFTFMIIINSLV